MSTNVVSAKDVKSNWHVIDAKGKILGRLAVEIAGLLRGKAKPSFVPYLDMGDYVVVTNTSQVKITGKKGAEKRYVRHSGYPGGLRVDLYPKVMKEKPTFILRHAVVGMLPGNKLGDKLIKKLHLFEGSEHPFKAKVASRQSPESRVESSAYAEASASKQEEVS